MLGCRANFAIPINHSSFLGRGTQTPDWCVRMNGEGGCGAVLHFTLRPEDVDLVPACMQQRTFFGDHKRSDRGFKYEVAIKRVEIVREPNTKKAERWIFHTNFTTLIERNPGELSSVYAETITITAFPENNRISDSETRLLLGLSKVEGATHLLLPYREVLMSVVNEVEGATQLPLPYREVLMSVVNS